MPSILTLAASAGFSTQAGETHQGSRVNHPVDLGFYHGLEEITQIENVAVEDVQSVGNIQEIVGKAGGKIVVHDDALTFQNKGARQMSSQETSATSD